MRRTTGLRVHSIVHVGGAGRRGRVRVGGPLAPEFLVNGHTTGNQWAGSVARLSDGGFVVVWYGPGTGDADGIFARRFDVSGAPAGPEFRVNTNSSGTSGSPPWPPSRAEGSS